jgi:heme exporter protein D
MSEFFMMGGHAGFIWPAYGVVVSVLVGLWWISRRALVQSDKDLQVLQAQQPAGRRRGNALAAADNQDSLR